MQNVVVMGVSGCGKSTIAAMLAERLGFEFGDADAFHAQQSIIKMSAGRALGDEDRQDWLNTLSDWIAEKGQQGRPFVLACSALKVAYRDALRMADPNLYFAHLLIDEDVSTARVSERVGHFPTASIVRSQFETIEGLEPYEQGATFDGGLLPSVLVDSIVACLIASEA